MRARARPRCLTRAISRMVLTDSSRARSMKAHVFTTRQSATSARSVISCPARASMPSMSSESTWFLGQPRVVKWTFMASDYDPTAVPGESNRPQRRLDRGKATGYRARHVVARRSPAARAARPHEPAHRLGGPRGADLLVAERPRDAEPGADTSRPEVQRAARAGVQQPLGVERGRFPGGRPGRHSRA